MTGTRQPIVPMLEVARAPDPVTIRRPAEQGLGGLSIYGAIILVVAVLVLGTAAYQILRTLSRRRGGTPDR